MMRRAGAVTEDAGTGFFPAGQPAAVGGGGDAGGGGGGLTGFPPGTTAVCAEFTFVVPAGLVAISCARRVEPWSAVWTTYVLAVAPVPAQLFPDASQRSHAQEKSTRNLLAQPASFAVSVEPTVAVPVTVGSPVFVGPVP